MAPERVALLLDGGFVTKRFRRIRRRHPTPGEIEELCSKLIEKIEGYNLYRIFFYDADPYTGESSKPISGETVDFGKTKIADYSRGFLSALERKPNFSVRRGELLFGGWKIGSAATKKLQEEPLTQIDAGHFVPNFTQKGVDMRIGLDIAALALKRLVQAVLLVTGDSDMVPAMRFARREGLRVYLHTMGFKGIRPILKAHADVVI